MVSIHRKLLRLYAGVILAAAFTYAVAILLFALLAGPDRQCGFMDDIGACSYGEQVRYFLPFIVYIALMLWPATLSYLLVLIAPLCSRRFKPLSTRTMVVVAAIYLAVSLLFMGVLMIPHNPSGCNERLSNGKIAPYNSAACGR
jgi:hypothetical protein